MLIQLIANRPQILGQIVSNTPVWVWGLLAGLIALGLSQVRDRTVGLRRVSVLPLAMAALSLSGTVTALAGAPNFTAVMLAWAATAVAMLAALGFTSPAAATRYDPVTRRFALPGSWFPLALFVGIFLTKYVVGVDLAMQPSLAQDSQYTLVVGAVYGAISGLFAGRAARLWRLALRPSPILASTVTA
jgi:hypothetical protein